MMTAIEADLNIIRSIVYQFSKIPEEKVETKYDKDNLYNASNKRYYRIQMWDGMWIDVEEKDFYRSVGE